MSIDVEDGLNILMHDYFHIEMPPTERVLKNVNVLLKLFGENKVRGTFFILGEIAATYPDLVKSIANAGHEIGVHGFYHDQFFKLSRDKAKKEIFRAKELIEMITGTRIYGFRAPAFSISESTSWALEVISELGFKYDSSIMPAKASRYGWPGFCKDIVRLELQNGNSLIEVPLSVVNIMGRTVPTCGGGYLRYLPYSFTREAILSIQKHRPAIVYLHPYELDKEKYPDFFYKARSSSELQKRLPLMLYRLNKKSVEKKLEYLVKEFNFKPINDIIEEIEKQGNLPVKYL
ncbi:MAG: polysaccharide deacetylase family protein [Bacteroidales bacterium]|nr:polysaccharide deacetylase family protein [Bacteroidales bacterium]